MESNDRRLELETHQPIEEDKQKNQNNNNSIDNSKPKSFKFIIIIIILLIIIIGLISSLIYIILKSKDKKDDKDNDKNNDKDNTNESQRPNKEEENIPIYIENNEIINNNLINALYQVEEGKTISFFNNDDSNLQKNDFIITKKSFSQKNLRYLNNLQINNSFYTPKESGNLSIEISFKKNLTSLSNFFKNNNNLLKADLKNFNMEGVVTMKSTFSGCSNLLEVDLEGVDSKNLKNMDNTFEKCTKLIKVNLSMKNISKYLESNNTFMDCENLKNINLSTFQNINKNMFLGIKSNPTIQANELISNDLNYVFNINLNITINIIISTKESNNELKGMKINVKIVALLSKKLCNM